MEVELPLPNAVRRTRWWHGIHTGLLCLFWPYAVPFAIACGLRCFVDHIDELLLERVFGVVSIVAFGSFAGLLAWGGARGIYRNLFWPCPNCPGRLRADLDRSSHTGHKALVCRQCKVRWDSGERYIPPTESRA